ncbi:hypothetical protein L3Q82_021583, partial [Scortum barcoo]
AWFALPASKSDLFPVHVGLAELPFVTGSVHNLYGHDFYKGVGQGPEGVQDFEVDYVGDRSRDPSQWRPPPPPPEQTVFLPQDGPAYMSNFHSPQSPFGGFQGDAAHYETPQLAPGRLQRRNLATNILPETPTSYQWGSYRDPAFYPNIRDIQEENTKLLQSHQAFQSTLKELNEARNEMKELKGVARTLREDMEQCIRSDSSHSSYQPVSASAATSQRYPIPIQPGEEDEGDWPDPPPWPEPEDDLPTGMSRLNLVEQDIHNNQLPHGSQNQAKSSSKSHMFAS